MQGRTGRGKVAGWILGALMLGSALFSIGVHVVMLAQAESRSPRAGAVAEWPF
jgi:hypothetical protein